jgi:hypothetical protein
MVAIGTTETSVKDYHSTLRNVPQQRTPKRITNSMQQNLSWKPEISTASPKISQILRNQKFHYSVQNIPPFVPILRQTNSVHDAPFYVNMIVKHGTAVPWLRRLAAGLPPRRPGFDPRSVHVGFVADKVALGQVFSRILRFSL